MANAIYVDDLAQGGGTLRHDPVRAGDNGDHTRSLWFTQNKPRGFGELRQGRSPYPVNQSGEPVADGYPFVASA